MARSCDARALPVAHRLALLYLMLPVVAWLLGWFRWYVGVPLALLLAVALRPALSGPWRGWPRPATWGHALAALVWVMLTGAGSVFDDLTSDWLDHRTTLLDLGRHPWPVFLPDPLAAYVPEAASATPLLRYYLGWHLMPGLAARLWGPGALQWAVPLWTGIGVALVLILFAQGHRGRRAALAAALLIFFSGMDVLRVLLREGGEGLRAALNLLNLEHYSAGPVALWKNFSSMAHLRWVPHHFIAGGLYALLLWRLRRHARFLAVSGLALAAAPFWSVFAAAGLVPLAAALLWMHGLRPFARWPNLALAGPLAGLVALYLTSGAVTFPHGWIWDVYPGSLLARWGPLFYLTEFLGLALLLLAARPSLRREPFFAASVGVLSLYPLYRFSGQNDLIYRGTIPALVLLAGFCADALVRPRGQAEPARRWARAGLAGALVVGACTPAIELTRSLRHVHFFRYAHAPLTTLVDLPVDWQRENVAFAPPPLLRALLQAPDPARRPAAPRGELVARGPVTVYRDGRLLVYIRAQCSPPGTGAEERTALFRHVTPTRADADPAPALRRLRLNAMGHGHDRMRAFGTACGWVWPLPPFDVAALRTGQTRVRGQPGYWRMELAFDAAGAIASARYQDERALRAAYQALAARPPAVSGAFDAHLAPSALSLVRETCARGDFQSSFFLHVIPFERAALPAYRQAVGFENRDFPLEAFGSRVGDACWAAAPLPAYPIRALRVGQFAADGVGWRVDIPFAERVPSTLDPLRRAYRAVTARPPAVRAVFDVYLADDHAAFVKEPCRPEDTASKFILHVTPVDKTRLARPRRALGFDNLDFAWEGYGARFDGKCFARRALPAYAMERLRVGQFDSAAQRDRWTAEIAVPPT